MLKMSAEGSDTDAITAMRIEIEMTSNPNTVYRFLERNLPRRYNDSQGPTIPLHFSM